jgi:hypothetical protein
MPSDSKKLLRYVYEYGHYILQFKTAGKSRSADPSPDVETLNHRLLNQAAVALWLPIPNRFSNIFPRPVAQMWK